MATTVTAGIPIGDPDHLETGAFYLLPIRRAYTGGA